MPVRTHDVHQQVPVADAPVSLYRIFCAAGGERKQKDKQADQYSHRYLRSALLHGAPAACQSNQENSSARHHNPGVGWSATVVPFFRHVLNSGLSCGDTTRVILQWIQEDAGFLGQLRLLPVRSQLRNANSGTDAVFRSWHTPKRLLPIERAWTRNECRARKNEHNECFCAGAPGGRTVRIDRRTGRDNSQLYRAQLVGRGARLRGLHAVRSPGQRDHLPPGHERQRGA